MALPTYASPLERVWYYTYLVICGLIFVFLIAPVLIVIPLSFNAETRRATACAGMTRF